MNEPTKVEKGVAQKRESEKMNKGGLDFNSSCSAQKARLELCKQKRERHTKLMV